MEAFGIEISNFYLQKLQLFIRKTMAKHSNSQYIVREGHETYYESD